MLAPPGPRARRSCMAAILGTVGYDVGGLFVGQERRAPTAVGHEPEQDGGGAGRRVRHRVRHRGGAGCVGRARPDRLADGGRPRRPGRGLRGAARRPVRVARQAGPRREGHGVDPARATAGSWTASTACSSSCPPVWLLPSTRTSSSEGLPASPARRLARMRVTTVSIAGSTGSIGTQTLEVVGAEPDRFEVVALGARSSVEDLAAQAQRWSPKVVAIADAVAGRASWPRRCRPGTEVRRGARRAGVRSPPSPTCA